MLKRRTVLTHSAPGRLAAVPLALPQARWPRAARTRSCWPWRWSRPGLDPTGRRRLGHRRDHALQHLRNAHQDQLGRQGHARCWPKAGRFRPTCSTYTFKLRKGVKFQNGEPFNAQAVKFSFERAGAEKSTNKDKRTFANLERCRWSTTTRW